jgi:hypothetical protein
MNSFKDAALKILKEAGKPLHAKEITEIALKNNLIKTNGKTPDVTMNARLITDINLKKEKSLFIKTAPAIFYLNKNYLSASEPLNSASHAFTEGLSAPKTLNDSESQSVVSNVNKKDIKESKKTENIYKISKDVSTKQKGDIAEARIAELIMLYGDTTLSCYKPISDDEGIDLIVKEKGSLKTMYIQIKSRFGSYPNNSFTANVKTSFMQDNYSMAVIFCFFNVDKGDLDNVWFIPAPDFIELANNKSSEKHLGFSAGRKKKESNKWNKYLTDKKSLANKIIEQMKRI